MGVAKGKQSEVKISSFRQDALHICISDHLDAIGTFPCEVSVGKNTTNDEFCRINGKGDPLLGRDTAASLGDWDRHFCR